MEPTERFPSVVLFRDYTQIFSYLLQFLKFLRATILRATSQWLLLDYFQFLYLITMTFLKRIQNMLTQETCLTNFKEHKIYRSSRSELFLR